MQLVDLTSQKKRARDRYMMLKKNMKKEGKDDPKYFLDRLDDLDKRLINILPVEEIEQMSGRSIEPLEPGMLVCSPLHIAGSRSNSPVSEASLHSQPISEVWLPKEAKFSDEMEDNYKELNLPNPPKTLPVRKKRKRQSKRSENEEDEDLHLLEDMLEMKKKKLAHIQKMEEIEKKKLNLKIRKEKRDCQMLEIMMKKDEREVEEHKIKMQIMKTKLEVLKKQLKK